jgi:hypothetical protein
LAAKGLGDLLSPLSGQQKKSNANAVLERVISTSINQDGEGMANVP